MELWEAWQPVFRLARPDPWHMVHVPSLLAYLSPGDLDCNNSKVWTRAAVLSNKEYISSAVSLTLWPPWIMERLQMLTMLSYTWAKIRLLLIKVYFLFNVFSLRKYKILKDTCTCRKHKVLHFGIMHVHKIICRKQWCCTFFTGKIGFERSFC